jgi:hypothetical protein
MVESEEVRWCGHSAQQFLPVVVHLVHHLTPSLTTIEIHSLSVRTGLLTGISIPVVAGQIHQFAPLLLDIGLLFPISYWLLDFVPLFSSRPISMSFLPAPFTSPRGNQLESSIFTIMKTSNPAYIYTSIPFIFSIRSKVISIT